MHLQSQQKMNYRNVVVILAKFVIANLFRFLLIVNLHNSVSLTPRPDRTEVLTESLQEAEKRIDQIKVTCETVAKKVHDCLQGRGKDAGIDKRIVSH